MKDHKNTLYRAILLVVVENRIHSELDKDRNEAESLSFYYSRPDKMLAMMVLSQHQVSSSITVKPRAPCGVRYMGHAVRTWSAVYSEAPHSQFGERTRSHASVHAIAKTQVSRQLSFDPSCSGKIYFNKPGTGTGAGYEHTEHPVTMRQASFKTLSTIGECERCDIRLVHSTQLLSRPEIEQLCAVFWHQYHILSVQVASAV